MTTKKESRKKVLSICILALLTLVFLWEKSRKYVLPYFSPTFPDLGGKEKREIYE